MIQDDITQRRTVMRGAMDTCCSLWAPILPLADVLTAGVIADRVDSDDDASSPRTESDIQQSPRE